MKIKLDENLPHRLKAALVAMGYDTDTAVDEGLGGQSDQLVWERAQQEERFLITQDMDFSDLRQIGAKPHHGVLLVRLHEPGRDALVQIVSSALRDNAVEQWKGRFVVITERRIRVR